MTDRQQLLSPPRCGQVVHLVVDVGGRRRTLTVNGFGSAPAARYAAPEFANVLRRMWPYAAVHFVVTPAESARA